MKFLFLLLLAIQISFAQNKIQKGLIPLNTGLVISYEASITSSANPVLVFLPGIYRGLTQKDDFIKQLSKTNLNWVTFHYSLQPESHINVKKINPTTVFDKVDLKELSLEPYILTQALKIQKPIFISLSYSSLISSTWSKNYIPWLVEVSPMGRFDEQNPGFSAYGQAWEIWMKQIPFWGSVVTNSTKEIAYYNYWTLMVQGLRLTKSEFNNPQHFANSVSGYVRMTKIAEGFDFRKQNFMLTPNRVFVLAEKEDAYRSQIQKEAIALYQKQTGKTPYVFIVKDAGHIIPMDTPAAYLQILNRIYTGQLPADKNTAVVSKEGHIEWLKR